MSLFNNILFLDIETAPQYSKYDDLDENWKRLWDIKAGYLARNKEGESPSSLYPRAGIYAEFGKIICVSCGVLQGSGNDRKLIIKSFFGDDERLLLIPFSEMLNKWASENGRYLCAHNGKEFDFPYLCRRLIVNDLPVPSILHIAGKKPWEVNHLDTLDMWKFGDFKNYISLDLLAHSLGVTTSKDDIDGSMVCDVYWVEKNLTRIVTYCQKDVITVAQVYLRMNGATVVSKENIEIKS